MTGYVLSVELSIARHEGPLRVDAVEKGVESGVER
jgi:hypothetical protein